MSWQERRCNAEGFGRPEPFFFLCEERTYSPPRRSKLRIVRFRLRPKAHSLRCFSFPRKAGFAGTSPRTPGGLLVVRSESCLLFEKGAAYSDAAPVAKLHYDQSRSPALLLPSCNIYRLQYVFSCVNSFGNICQTKCNLQVCQSKCNYLLAFTLANDKCEKIFREQLLFSMDIV